MPSSMRARSGSVQSHLVDCLDEHNTDPEPTSANPIEWKSTLPKRVLAAARAKLFARVPAASLATFRMLFGACMIMQTGKFDDVFENFKDSSMVFPYGGLGYFPPLQPDVGNNMLRLLAVSSACTMIGFCTRLSCVLNFVLFTYVFHICESNHNNHYILFCHVTFATIFLDWGNCLSVDARLRARKFPIWLPVTPAFLRNKSSSDRWQDVAPAPVPTVPYWQLLIMQILFNIPYFFGAIAKCNYDWLLRAEPPITWFSKRNDWIFQQWWFPWFIAWGGAAFDLGISFLLWWRPTRYIIAFPSALLFHSMNKYMFNIGVFPIIMSSALVLFIEPLRIARFWTLATLDRAAHQGDLEITGGGGEASPKENKRNARQRNTRELFTLAMLTLGAIFHTLFPLRHLFLYPSNPSWSEEGHHGAWHMMLRTKKGWTLLEAIDDHGERILIDPISDPTINYRQTRKISQRPHMLLLYVEHLSKVYKAAGLKLDTVHVHSCFRLNGRPPQHYYVVDANALDYVGKYENLGVTMLGKWIEHLAPLDKPVPERISCHANKRERHGGKEHIQDVMADYGTSRSAETHKFLQILTRAGLTYNHHVMFNKTDYAYTLKDYPSLGM